MPPQNVLVKGRNQESQLSRAQNSYNVLGSSNMALEPIPVQHVPIFGHRDGRPPRAMSEARVDTVEDVRYVEGGQIISSGPSRELSLDVEDLDIPWSDLVLKERIGAGNFCTIILIITM